MTKANVTLIAILALIGVFAPLSLLSVLIYKGVEPSALVAGFIGMMLSSYPMIFQYYFGSSSGSKTKQETIDKMTNIVAEETEDQKKARWAASGSPAPFDEWIKLPENATKTI